MQSCSPVFLRYDNILLRDYFEIARDGSYGKLLVQGVATPDECKEQWNKIVAECFNGSGTFDFIGYLDNLESYNHWLQEHNVITAQLVVLHFQVDEQIISELKEKGYNIDTSGKRAYLKSLIAAVQRSRSLLSNIKIKANQMQSYNDTLQDSKPATFDEIMAMLVMSLGFTVSDDITLARYNHYRKQLEQKYKQSAA